MLTPFCIINKTINTRNFKLSQKTDIEKFFTEENKTKGSGF